MSSDLNIALIIFFAGIYIAGRTLWFLDMQSKTEVKWYLQDYSVMKILLYFWSWNFEKLVLKVYKHKGD